MPETDLERWRREQREKRNQERLGNLDTRKEVPMPDKTPQEPQFGQWFTGIYASEHNPKRHGMYVRTVKRTGKMNSGTFYELTDGKGGFWEYPVPSVEPKAPEALSNGATLEVDKADAANHPPDKHQRAHTPEETIRIILKGTIATVTGDTYPEIDEVDVKALLNLIARTNQESYDKAIEDAKAVVLATQYEDSQRIAERIAALEPQTNNGGDR